MSAAASIGLAGPAGEPVDLWRTINSHGLVALPPMRIDREGRALEIILALNRAKPRAVQIRQRRDVAIVEAFGAAPSARVAEQIERRVRYLLRLDEDLSDFYELIADDPELSWATKGAGRMVRSASVFEDAVKTICTTNCAWSATERMVGTLVTSLGRPAIAHTGHAFPTPEVMAQARDDFYRERVRAGYRGPFLKKLAQSVADGSIDLDRLADREHLSDDSVEDRLLALPGIGPYAAAHIMMLLGRYSRLVLDSWTRPKYARLVGRKVKDSTIRRRFSRYGEYAGLAFWLYLTRDWVDDPVVGS